MEKKYKIVVAGLVAVSVVLAAVDYIRRTNVQVLNPKGPIAAQEKHLLLISVLLMLIVVVPVFILLFAFAWRYRETNPKATYSPELQGSRVAETIWWLIPTALIAVLAVITWRSTHQLDPYKPLASSTPPINIQVVALNWKWLFIYPNQHIATVNYLEFPKNTPLNFTITSDATMNSFWIPQLGGQIYAMSGMTTQLHLMASTIGSYRGSSANISGRGFAGMHFMAHATTAGDFQRWVAQVKTMPADLNSQSYAQLAQPTVNNRPAFYASSQNQLFSSIIDKYLPAYAGPGGELTSMSGMDMGGSQL